ncbi:hypothetical protein FRB99_004934 [Tulasnella sp. 403]|nr:hypothetical protein FRB99_004934 [Tulasnella sp. 403]
MAAIKSPAQRAQFAHRSAQRTLVSSPSRMTTSPGGIFPTSENRSLGRSRRGRPPPPLQKPVPNAPLPALPPLPFTESNEQRPVYLRRDSDTLPLPSPTFASFSSRPSTTAVPSLLAPSPVIGGRPRSGSASNRRDGFDAKTPQLAALHEEHELEAKMSLE